MFCAALRSITEDFESVLGLFMHVSDIESEYVPMPGDRITFKLTRIPPKNEKFQAVEVRIVGLCLDEKNAHHHVRWDGSPSGI